MNFHEARFPENMSFGSVGGPERRTEIVTLSNGFEERNTPWAHSRRRYDAGMGMRSLDDLEALIAFFEARRGRLFGFRWKDWTDFKSCIPSAEVGSEDQELGVGNGVQTEFDLIKRYLSGAEGYARPVKKPVEGSVRVAIDAVEAAIGIDFTVDVTMGVIGFATPPQTGAVVTAGFEFDVPVRFDADRIDSSLGGFSSGEIPSVPVVEVRV